MENVTYNDANCIERVALDVAYDPTRCGIQVAFRSDCSSTFFYDISSQECSCVKKNHDCIRKKHGVQSQYRILTSMVVHK